MQKLSRGHILALLLILVCLASGCSTISQGVGGIFNLLGTVIGGTFKIIGKALDVAGSLPTPPGVF